MIYSFHQKDMGGILLGTSKVEQLKASIDFYEKMKTGDFFGIYYKLRTLK